MLTGTIASWKTDRGFGFIARDDGQGEIFVHFRSLVGQDRDWLPTRTKVSFDIAPDERSGKPRAVNVAVIGENAFAGTMR